MKRLSFGIWLLALTACSEVEWLSPKVASRQTTQRIASFEAHLRYQTADGTVAPLEGAAIPAGTDYRIFTDREAMLWQGQEPFKCLFWLDTTYHNREAVPPYDFNHTAGSSTGAGQNEELPAGKYRLNVRGYYGSQKDIIHQQEDMVSFTVGKGGNEEDTVIFFEDFDGTSLHEEKWATRFWWSCDPDGGQSSFNNNLQWFRPENVSVRDGYAHLTADNQSYRSMYRGEFDYTGGVISTHHTDDTSCGDLSNQDRVEFRYGTVEVRMQLPQGENTDGLWPAIWLITSDERHPPEIDILEVLGEHPTTAEFHVHYLDETNQPAQYGKGVTVAGLSEGFHTYKIDWTPDTLTWYVDDEPLYEVTDPLAIPDQALHLIINHAISSGEWGQKPTAATTFPTTLRVDWVRISQSKAL